MSEVVLAMASELKEDVVLDQAIVNKTGHQGNSAQTAISMRFLEEELVVRRFGS